MARDSNQFEKIVKASSYAGVADIVLANVKDPDQIEDLVSLYEMQKATGTYDQEEFQDLLMEVSDPLGKVWNRSGGTQGPFPVKKVDTEERVQDEIGKLIGEIQNKPEKKKKISPAKLMGTKPQGGVSSGVDPDKLIPKTEEKEEEEDGDKKQRTKRFTAAAVEQLAVNLNAIARELTGINEILSKQLKQNERFAKETAALALQSKRRREEKSTEADTKSKNAAKGALDFVKKPVESFFDKLKTYFTNILVGGALVGILKWLQDENNQKKVQDFVDFVVDTIPLVLAGLAAFVAANIGAKLIGLTGSLIGLTKGLIGLLGPLGLLGLLGAIAAFVAAKFIQDQVRPIIQKMTGGFGFTETGLLFGYEDIVALRNKQREFLVQNGVSGADADRQLEGYDNLMSSMRENKRINDELYQLERNITTLRQTIARNISEGDTRSAERNQGLLDQRLQEKAVLQNNKAYASARVTQLYGELKISESDLERQITSRGGQIVRSPGSVQPSVRPSPQTGTGTSGSMGYDSSNKVTQAASQITQGMGGDTNITNYSENMMSTAMPKFESNMNDYVSQIGESYKKGTISSPNMNTGKLMLDTKNIFSSRGPTEILPPMMPEQTFVLPGPGGRKNTPSSYATASQKVAPSFSSFDSNNESFAAVLAIYNAL